MNFFEKTIKTLKSVKNWYMVVPDKLGMIGGLIYKARNNTKLYCRAKTTDINEFVVLLTDVHYPLSLLKIDQGSVVFDLGANIGGFCAVFETMNKGVDYHMVCVEPFVGNIKILKQNIKLNQIRNIDIIEGVVSSKDTQLLINTKLNYTGIKIDDVYGDTTVRSWSLESIADFCKVDIIDLVKMDIEGAEYDLIENSLPFFEKKVKKVILEYHEFNGQGLRFFHEKLYNTFDVTEISIKKGEEGGTLLLENKKYK